MKKRRVLLIVLPIILFVMLAISIFGGIVTNFEEWTYSELVEHMSPLMTTIVKCITHIGDASSVIIICLLIILIPKTRVKYGIPVAIAVISATVLNIILKNIFMRERPTILNLITETSYSFPSGHAMVNACLYTMLIYLVWRFLKSKNLKIILTFSFLAITIIIGFSRVYLGVHYITDIIGGWLLGFVVASLIYYFYEKKVIKAQEQALIDE